MSQPDALTDGTPLMLTAPTGARSEFGGKTALATWFADGPLRDRDLVVFYNPKHDDVAGVLDDYREVSTVEELADAMGAGASRLVVTPQTADWEGVSERLCAFIRALPDDMSKAVILDEAPELDEDSLLTFVRVLGNGSSTKTLLLNQSPTDMPGALLKNVVVVWVGVYRGAYDSWFRSHDLGAHIDGLGRHSPYEWSMLLGPGEEDRVHYEPVPEQYGGI